MSEVTRDWDAERSERYPEPPTFKIGGEVFTVLQGITPEEFSEKAAPYFAITSDTPADEATKLADDFIIAFLADEDGAEKWRKVRSQRKPAVTAREMREITIWILEEQTGVPTQPLTSSENGHKDGGGDLTVDSSSPPAESEASVA